MLKSIQIRNLLSFGPDTPTFEFGPLSIFIGPNGSGKSNLLETVGLLKAAAENLAVPVKESGGVKEWLHKPYHKGSGSQSIEATIEAIVAAPRTAAKCLLHTLVVGEHGSRFEVVDEKVTYPTAKPGQAEPYFFYKFQRGFPILNQLNPDRDPDKGQARRLEREIINPEQSVLSQVRDPVHYPELNYLGSSYRRIALFRDWVFGRYTPPRIEQKVGLPNDYLTDTCDNLALVLAEIIPSIGDDLVEALQSLYPEIKSIHTKPSGDRLQVYFREGSRLIPATRLSDGTLRYLSILAALLHPSPPPLICIDEPDLGLHPDVLPSLADILRKASERTQIIITTHSELLVEAFTDHPEYVVVFDKENGATTMRRLDADALHEWLKQYSLGELWSRGKLGGTRW